MGTITLLLAMGKFGGAPAVVPVIGPGRITVGAAILRGVVHGNAVRAGLQVGASLNNGVHAGAAVR